MTDTEINIAKATSRSSGASALNRDGTIRAVVPIFVERNIDKSKSILDFGSGKGATSTKYLKEKGFNVTAYDLWCDDGDELLDKNALNKKYDVVFASNVLNVQSSLKMFVETIRQMWCVLNVGGELICNYPNSPRKMCLNADSIGNFIFAELRVAPERIGGTKSAPIWRVRKFLS